MRKFREGEERETEKMTEKVGQQNIHFVKGMSSHFRMFP